MAVSDAQVLERRFVIFAPHGMVLPADAYRLWLDLQARGFTLKAEDGALVVSPPERLTRQDCVACRRWRWHLLMFIDRAHTTRVVAVAPRVSLRTCETLPPCPYCDSTSVERLGAGWWWCACCAREFRHAGEPRATS